MNPIPAPLTELVEELRDLGRHERAEELIHYADRFRPVAPEVATRPFDSLHLAPRCESDAYVWATDRPDGTLQFHFAVENPQGVSARAWSVILDETLSGQPIEQVAAVPGDVLYAIFGRDLSMGKGQGLLGMLELVTYEAQKRLSKRRVKAMREPGAR